MIENKAQSSTYPSRISEGYSWLVEGLSSKHLQSPCRELAEWSIVDTKQHELRHNLREKAGDDNT